MVIEWNTIILAASVITALGVIVGLILKVYSWFLEMQKLKQEIEKLRKTHNEDIKPMKEENALICYALSACLDGLQQLGANHTVPLAKEKLDKYLNEKAHK